MMQSETVLQSLWHSRCTI